MRLLPTFSPRSIFLFKALIRLTLLTRRSCGFFLSFRTSASTLPPHSTFRPDQFHTLFTTMKASSSSADSGSMEHRVNSTMRQLQDVIGTDAGGRGMKSLIVEGDLMRASEILAKLPVGSNVLVLSGFPCCVYETPPTETDGPPGAVALARAACVLGYHVTLLTDHCNHDVFAVAMENLQWNAGENAVVVESFQKVLSEQDEKRFTQLAGMCDLLLACERAGPAVDGRCYTMRGIDMTEIGLIAPLHRLVKETDCPFLAIGDGGNELGMGKVYEKIVDNPKIMNGSKIACSLAADHLIVASVSNWGGYALAAGSALMKAKTSADNEKTFAAHVREWVGKCLPTEEEEVALLQRCVNVGCRDGISGKVEATVDGMPLERSMQCLRDIRSVALAVCESTSVPAE